jgi:hypothetical protein
MSHGDGVAHQLAGLSVLVERALSELLALRAEVRELGAAVRAARRKPDDRRLAELLPAIRDVLGDDEFAAAWLVEASIDSVPGAQALRAALACIMRGAAAGATKRLGHFLAQHAGANANELRLERIGESRDGATYKVAQVARASPARATIAVVPKNEGKK